MQTPSKIIKSLGIAMLMSIAIPVFAESAPVYDMDSMQQFETADTGQEFPPPPPPSSANQDSFQDGQESGFVPMQPETPAVTVSPAPSVVPPQQPVSLDQRVRRMEQRVDNLQTNDQSARVEALQAEVQSLRGQLEKLTHQLEVAENLQKSQYSDLDKRLTDQLTALSAAASAKHDEAVQVAAKSAESADNQADAIAPKLSKAAKKANKAKAKTKTIDDSTLSQASAEPSSALKAKSSASQPNVAEEQQIYQTAYNLIKAKKYNDAVNALQNMLNKYPSGQFASNAHYWLGELYGLLGKNDKALGEFETLVKSYPSSPRVSDAQLKVGLIFAAQMKWPDAKNMFKKIINHYPGTTSARLALEQLKQIKQAGH